MSIRIIVATACLLGFSFAALGDDTLRCDRVIVRLGMIADEVIAKCGEPKSRQVEEIPIRARNRSGGTSSVVGAAIVETWIYDRGDGQFPAELKFDQGKLKSIKYLTGR